MHILFTRPLEDCYEMILKFQSLGHEISHMPLISIEKVNFQNLNYSDFQGVIFTSAKSFGINIIVENHGGYSSNAKWLVNVIKNTGMDNVGTLPDFGNFCIRSKPTELTDWGSSVGGCLEEYDKYLGVKEMMPYARSVSAKTHNFDSNGNSVETDYYKMLKIINDFGYKGYISIEYEGEEYSEHEGILLTKQLLEKAGRNV